MRLQLAINAEQRVEIDRLKRELEQSRAEVSRANNALQNKEMVGTCLLVPSKWRTYTCQSLIQIRLRDMFMYLSPLSDWFSDEQCPDGSPDRERGAAALCEGERC